MPWWVEKNDRSGGFLPASEGDGAVDGEREFAAELVRSRKRGSAEDGAVPRDIDSGGEMEGFGGETLAGGSELKEVG